MTHSFFRPFLAFILLFGNLNVLIAPAPPNDDLANAKAIPSLPFLKTGNVSGATLELNEPQPCTPIDRSIWYTFESSEPMVLMIEALNSSTNLGIYFSYHTNPTVSNLESIYCVNSGNPITFAIEPGITFYIQAGIPAGAADPVQFKLSEANAIFGRVIDAATGTTIPPWSAPHLTLQKVCGEGCLERVSSTVVDSGGRFWFDSSLGFGSGTYMIEVRANLYQTKQFSPVEFNGSSLDVGDLALDPLPPIRLIQGRLLDKGSGKPVPPTFTPVVYLNHCDEDWLCLNVNQQVLDRDGQFRFETDDFGEPLASGRYMIFASANQYEFTEQQFFEVREGKSYNVGNMRIRSYPIRFSDVTSCEDLPASGGICQYSVRVWNGLASKMRGDAWSVVNITRSDTVVGYADFQTRKPQPVVLERGGSRVLRFQFKVPAQDASFQFSFCPRIYLGRGSNPFFNIVDSEELFCMLLGGETFELAPPSETTARRGEEAITAGKKNVEPNNSCQQAERLGFVSSPVRIDGSLDPSATTDIDYYRFRGIPGQPVMIEQEGEPTGKGTLADPMLNVFDSRCSLIKSNDNSETLNSRMVVSIPEDGVLVLGATASSNPDLRENWSGTYQLTITPLSSLTTISGTVVEAGTGAPLAGDASPFTVAYLLKCDGVTCLEIAAEQSARNDGRFHFDSAWNGMPLTAGEYRLFVVAEQYQTTETMSFFVQEGEQLDIGNVEITPWPIQFSEIEGCAIAASGGLCEYSAQITNRLSTPFSGKAWSIVHAASDDTSEEVTLFQTGTPLNIRLEPGASRTVRFRLRLRDALQEPMHLCAQGFVGQNPDTYFTPVGFAYLLCLAQGPDGWELVFPTHTREASREMQRQLLQWYP
jgi:hypothetical protein